MNINISKLFDKYLTITTNDNTTIYIEKQPIYINDSSEYYGQRYIVTSDKLNKKNLYVLREIYSLDKKRLRYLYEKYTDVTLVNTIEKDENNNESALTVVECYKDKETLIGSIGNIRRIDSDILKEKENKNGKNKILQLILNNDKKTRSIEEAKLVA